jgi:hypothetical protein
MKRTYRGALLIMWPGEIHELSTQLFQRLPYSRARFGVRRFFSRTAAFAESTDLKLRRATILCAIAIPTIFFAFYGVHGGMPWDYSLTYVSESTPGLAGFLYGDPLRVYTNLFYNVGYLLPGLVDAQGSWAGYHIVYALLWAAKGILVLCLCYLLDLPLVIAAPAAVIAVAHGSDVSIGHVGQINQFGIVFWTLLSMCCFLGFLRSQRFTGAVLLVVAASASYFGLWSHEATLFDLLAYPILFIWATGRFRRRSAILGAAFVIAPPIVYSALMADRLIVHPMGNSYQEAALRKGIGDVGALARDYFHLLKGLVDVPEWLTGKVQLFQQFKITAPSFMTAQFLAASALALLISLYFCAALVKTICRIETAAAGTDALHRGPSDEPQAEGWATHTRHPNDQGLGQRPAMVRLNVMLFALASASVVPFLALDEGGGYWRTQLLAGPFASILMALFLFTMTVHVPRRAAMRSSLIGAVIYACTLLAVTMWGFTANAVSYQAYNLEWQQIRAPIERLLEAVPGVKSGTIIMLQGVPFRFNAAHIGCCAAWGSNYWFDMLLRLAYPKTEVAGSYALDLASATPGEIKTTTDSGGEVLQLANGRKILAPHGQLHFIDNDRVSLAKSYYSTLVDSAGIENVIVLEWRGGGPFKIVRNTDEIELAVNPHKHLYNPDARIDPAGLSQIARRRFFE